jgi:small conductance mechanosensitive channel
MAPLSYLYGTVTFSTAFFFREEKSMQDQMSRLQRISEAMSQHGTEMALAIIILIIGLVGARWIDRLLRAGLRRMMPTARFVTVFCNIVYIILIAAVISTAAVELGAKPIIIFRFLTIVTLIAVGLIIFFRPFLPSLPFKVGNTVKAGNLLGKVEAITFLNTRLRTFDGKTFFVPNRQILNDIVINYHFTQTRRVKINMVIGYDQDLLKAKRVLETIMIEDCRIRAKPGPTVYVLNLAANGVELGGRCWVDNKEYWVARCDLMEKAKLRFDREGIRFAFPQLDVHIDAQAASAGSNDMMAVKEMVDPSVPEG